MSAGGGSSVIRQVSNSFTPINGGPSPSVSLPVVGRPRRRPRGLDGDQLFELPEDPLPPLPFLFRNATKGEGQLHNL
jgi:hypothetical protein